MDRETIIRLAREAELWEMLEGYSSEYVSGNTEEDCLPDLERFAALVAAHERQRICAQIAHLHDTLALSSLPPGMKPKGRGVEE